MEQIESQLHEDKSISPDFREDDTISKRLKLFDRP